LTEGVGRYVCIQLKTIRMKVKFYLPLFILLFFGLQSKAQSRFGGDTLLFENFENDVSTYILPGFPTGSDSTWINTDADQLSDASGASRPGEWFQTTGFADVDTGTVVMAGDSWTNQGSTWVSNYLILPPIHLNGNNGMLYWKSAPYQTPRYLDGYMVLLSANSNDLGQFSDTLKKFAEFISGDAGTDSTFSNFQFSQGFVHGMDGQYIEYHHDSLRFVGVLRPDSVSLAAYAGQTVYIAFWQGTHDDNLLELDDICVRGSGSVGVQNLPAGKAPSLQIMPNPIKDMGTLSYVLPATSEVDIVVQDLQGRELRHLQHCAQIKGSYTLNFDFGFLPAGVYQVLVKTRYGSMVRKIVKQ